MPLPQKKTNHPRMLCHAVQADPSYIRLRNCVTSGFPFNRYDLHSELLPFWKLRDSISTDGDFVFNEERIVVSVACLLDGHRGAEATK